MWTSLTILRRELILETHTSWLGIGRESRPSGHTIWMGFITIVISNLKRELSNEKSSDDGDQQEAA